MENFKILAVTPSAGFNKDRQLPVVATYRCRCGKEHTSDTITCDCAWFKETLASIGGGKRPRITLPPLAEKDVELVRIDNPNNKRDVEKIFRGKTENVLPCQIGNGWNYLRVSRPGLDKRGNDTGKTVFDYYCFRFKSITTFDVILRKNKVYQHLLPEIIEMILENGQIPEFVISAYKKGKIPVMPE